MFLTGFLKLKYLRFLYCYLAKDAQTREDELILFSQSTTADPTFELTAQLLNRYALGSVRTPEVVRARYQEMLQSGRAQTLLRGPALMSAILKYRPDSL